MNWHKIIDQRNLELNGVIVRILRETPEKLDAVRERLLMRLADPEYSDSLKRCCAEWLEIINQGNDRVCEVLLDESEEGNRLRQNAPFAILMAQDERTEIFEKYKKLRPRSQSPSNVR